MRPGVVGYNGSLNLGTGGIWGWGGSAVEAVLGIRMFSGLPGLYPSEMTLSAGDHQPRLGPALGVRPCMSPSPTLKPGSWTLSETTATLSYWPFLTFYAWSGLYRKRHVLTATPRDR